MRFVADCMLGRLAKWLRMLGYDTVYAPDADDDNLVRTAVREDRILLTRDAELCDRRMVRKRCVFVDWGSTSAQVTQVLRQCTLRVSREQIFTRCAVCNSEIVPMDKTDVKNRVPPYVYQTQDSYGWCRHCDKIFWRGTHVQHVLDALEKYESERDKE